MVTRETDEPRRNGEPATSALLRRTGKTGRHFHPSGAIGHAPPMSGTPLQCVESHALRDFERVRLIHNGRTMTLVTRPCQDPPGLMLLDAGDPTVRVDADPPSMRSAGDEISR